MSTYLYVDLPRKGTPSGEGRTNSVRNSVIPRPVVRIVREHRIQDGWAQDGPEPDQESGMGSHLGTFHPVLHSFPGGFTHQAMTAGHQLAE